MLRRWRRAAGSMKRWPHANLCYAGDDPSEVASMAIALSRRNLLEAGIVAAVGAPFSASLPAQAANSESKEDFFYRDDWFGEPWRKPETVVLIHGNDESSVVWYAWVPQL